MRTYKRRCGFLTFAQNNDVVDYVRLAYVLALSLRATQSEVPYLAIAVTPGVPVPERYAWAFDEIVDIPWNDDAKQSDWKLENEWKAYHLTPYEHTIKLDADMLMLSDLAEWWQILASKDVWPCTAAVAYRGDLVTSDYYRRVFTSNGLPNVYTAFMFFKASATAQQLYDLTELIFRYWKDFSERYLDETRPIECSTDVAIGLAMKLLDIEYVEDWFPQIVHMKTHVQNLGVSNLSENWLEHIGVYLTNDLVLKIGAYRQLLPLHYHLKNFVTDEMIAAYEKKLTCL